VGLAREPARCNGEEVIAPEIETLETGVLIGARREMVLTKYRLAKLRERLREEAGVLDAASVRLKDLCLSIPAPDLGELRELEAGEVPLSIEAVWISLLYEHSWLADESAEALRVEADVNRACLKDEWWSGWRPDAKLIAHLRSGLRGRTLPQDFRPEHAERDARLLLQGQRYVSMVGAGMVTDLLVKGYRWGG
jgi:hypothetical protein